MGLNSLSSSDAFDSHHCDFLAQIKRVQDETTGTLADTVEVVLPQELVDQIVEKAIKVETISAHTRTFGLLT